MRRPQAPVYAEHLDGSSFGLGLFYLFFGQRLRSSCSMSPTATSPMVACAAFINAIMLF